VLSNTWALVIGISRSAIASQECLEKQEVEDCEFMYKNLLSTPSALLWVVITAFG